MQVVAQLERARLRSFPVEVLVFLFLIANRLLLNVAALTSVNHIPLTDVTTAFIDPRQLPGLWMRWDSGYYLNIALYGYSYHGKELAFFPGYPLLINAMARLGIWDVAWSGLVVSNLSFFAAMLLLWHHVKPQFGVSAAWGTVITLSLFPTAFFFSAIYSESLFLLLSMLAFTFSVRRQYTMAAVFVAVASITRANGIALLMVPFVEMYMHKAIQTRIQWVKVLVVGSLGLVAHALYLWQSQGSLLAFVQAQGEFNRRVDWPWQSIADSIGVAVKGYANFEDKGYHIDWFMRAVSLQDGLLTLLFVGCAVASYFLISKSLALYLTVAMVVLLSSHGPYFFGLYSMSRYVLVLFPGFVVIGLLLARLERTRWVVWSVSAVSQLFLTAWFASGRWVA